MQLNEVAWETLAINNRVTSSIDKVGGIILNLETIDNVHFITILWDSNIQMKFNHVWTNDITLGE